MRSNSAVARRHNKRFYFFSRTGKLATSQAVDEADVDRGVSTVVEHIHCVRKETVGA